MTLNGYIFKYESLLIFRYSYGCLGHSLKDCENSSDEDKYIEYGLQYGDWLRASPLR